MDPKDIEKQYEQLAKDVTSLREMLEMKFSPDKQKEEADKLFTSIMDRVHPSPKKMVWAVSDDKGQVPKNSVYFTQFLNAITPGNEHKVSDEVRTLIKTTMTETSSAQGGYTVPVEYAAEIIALEREYSKIRQLARIFPMGSLTRNIPRQLTNVAVAWTDEGSTKSVTKPTFEQLQQVAKKVAAVVKMTDELLEDNNVQLDNFVKQLVAEAIGLEEDRVAFAGNTGAGDPFMGVLYAAGVNVATMAGANITFQDLVDLIMSLNERYREGATLVTSTAGLQAIMKIVDLQGRPIWQTPGMPGQIPTIWGYPYIISDQIPTNLGTGAQTAIEFGNFKKHYFVSDRGGYEVIASNSAADTNASESAFMEDETWFRFKKRVSLDVALPAAFSRMIIS